MGLLGRRALAGPAPARLDAGEARRGDLGGGVAGPGGRLAGLRRDVLGRLAGLGGDALGRLAGLVVTSLASCRLRPSLAALRLGDVLGGVAPGLGRLLQDLGHLVGQGLQGLRVDLLELAGHLVAHQFEDLLAGLRLRSTKLSTHSCAWLRWMSPAFTNSRTISSARPRLTCPRTVPASRYLRMRSLLAIAQEYLKC